MTSTDHGDHSSREAWEDIGRAAEQFARQVAGDARRFAERIEKDAGDFARDVARDWSAVWHGAGRPSGAIAPDVHLIFADIRKFLADVVDGVDELIGGLFGGAPDGSMDEAPDERWTRVVANRDAACSACGGAIAAGGAAHARRTATGTDFRCLGCGAGPEHT